ncbi:recombinase family protein [Turicibacter sanguinis]|uniref:recombinase family protein n=1 Tax=Turicibacter sanguinis TaxID=154288 RepID=UPI00189DD384|nr:recombinase family protein [Turicibacter sanguinis]
MTTSDMIKAAAYCRFSSQMQADGHSIEAQQRAIYKYMAEKGYIPSGEYIDEAVTGTNLQRAAFNQMLEDAEKGLFDVVVVHKMDRFSRDVYDALDVERRLGSFGIRIESVIEQFSDTPEGQLQQIIQLGVGQYYSANLAREVMKGLKENAYKALHNGGIPPLGYDVNPETNQYVINEKEAQCIRIIFEKFLEGWTYRELADYLNLLGYTTKIGNKFSSKSSFYDLLTNPKYKGEYVYNRTVKKPKRLGMKRNHRKNKSEEDIIRIENGIPAIVTKETFDAVQTLFSKRQRTKSQKRAKTIYLLSGLVYCSECGSKYHGSARKGGRNKQEYVSYRCSKRKAMDKKCSCKEINRTLLDDFVLNQLFELVLNENIIEQLYERINVKMKERLNEKESELPKLKQQLKELDKQISNIVRAIALGGCNRIEAITAELQRLEKDKALIVEMIEEFEKEDEGYYITRDQIKELIVESRNFVTMNNSEMIKCIISRFVHQIRISNEAIEVEYNFGGFFNVEETMKLLDVVSISRLEIYASIGFEMVI